MWRARLLLRLVSNVGLPNTSVTNGDGLDMLPGCRVRGGQSRSCNGATRNGVKEVEDHEDTHETTGFVGKMSFADLPCSRIGKTGMQLPPERTNGSRLKTSL